MERAKGFHAFFVPLGRSLPPAPPSSPVMAPSQGPDYFGTSWDLGSHPLGQKKVSTEERWVEDVKGGHGSSTNTSEDEGSVMDVDSP